MKTLFTILSLLLIGSVANGQTYFSNAASTPGYTIKSDHHRQYPGLVSVTALTGTGGSDLQLAVSIQPKLLLLANGTLLNHQQNKHRFVEGGIGYTEKLDRTGRSTIGIYAGAGRGYTSNIAGSYSVLGSLIDSDFQGNYTRFFIQPEVSIKQRQVEFSMAARTVYLKHRSQIQEETPGRQSGTWLYEPAFTLKLGGQHGFFSDKKVIFQLGLIMGNEAVVQDPFKFSFGLAWHPKKKVNRIAMNAVNFF